MGLVISDGRGQRRFALEGERHTLGRDESCDFVVDDPSVSRKHVTFEQKNGQWFLTDEGSRNGTEVEGQKLSPKTPAPLLAGQRIRVGHLDLTVTAPVVEETFSTMEFSPEVFVPRQEAGSFDALAGEVLYRAQGALFPGQPMENLLESLVQLVLGYVPASRAAVQLLDGDGESQTAFAIDATSAEPVREALLSQGIRDRVLRAKKAVLVKDVAQDVDLKKRQSIVAAGITSAVAAPIFDGNDILGVLYADVRNARHELGEGDVAIVSLLASLAGPMLMAAQMVNALMQSEAALREENQILREQLEARGAS